MENADRGSGDDSLAPAKRCLRQNPHPGQRQRDSRMPEAQVPKLRVLPTKRQWQFEGRVARVAAVSSLRTGAGTCHAVGTPSPKLITHSPSSNSIPESL